MTVPYLGRGLFNLLGKQAMLQKLRNERLKDDFAHPELVPEIIEDTVQKLEWLLAEKHGFYHAFHSTVSFSQKFIFIFFIFLIFFVFFILFLHLFLHFTYIFFSYLFLFLLWKVYFLKFVVVIQHTIDGGNVK